MEGENLYKTSSEKKFLRKVAGDKDAPDVVSHSAQEDLARIKDDLSGLIGKEGGLQKTKERVLKDKGEAERQVQTGGLDLEGAVEGLRKRDLSQMILLTKLRSKATPPTSGNRPPRNSHSSP